MKGLHSSVHPDSVLSGSRDTSNGGSHGRHQPHRDLHLPLRRARPPLVDPRRPLTSRARTAWSWAFGFGWRRRLPVLAQCARRNYGEGCARDGRRLWPWGIAGWRSFVGIQFLAGASAERRKRSHRSAQTRAMPSGRSCGSPKLSRLSSCSAQVSSRECRVVSPRAASLSRATVALAGGTCAAHPCSHQHAQRRLSWSSGRR